MAIGSNPLSSTRKSARAAVGPSHRQVDKNKTNRKEARGLAAIDAATATDKGLPIGEAVIKSFRDRGVLLPSAERMDRIGRAGRAIARKRRLRRY